MDLPPSERRIRSSLGGEFYFGVFGDIYFGGDIRLKMDVKSHIQMTDNNHVVSIPGAGSLIVCRGLGLRYPYFFDIFKLGKDDAVVVRLDR